MMFLFFLQKVHVIISYDIIKRTAVGSHFLQKGLGIGKVLYLLQNGLGTEWTLFSLL